MNPTISIALGIVFLAVASSSYAHAKKPENENPQNSRFVALMFTIAGTGFFIAAAISYFSGD